MTLPTDHPDIARARMDVTADAWAEVLADALFVVRYCDDRPGRVAHEFHRYAMQAQNNGDICRSLLGFAWAKWWVEGAGQPSPSDRLDRR